VSDYPRLTHGRGRTIKLPVELDTSLLATLESCDLSKGVEFLGSVVIAGEEAPVFANSPSRAAFQLGAIPLDEINSILDILGYRLLGKNMLSRKKGFPDVRGLVRDGEADVCCQRIYASKPKLVCLLSRDSAGSLTIRPQPGYHRVAKAPHSSSLPPRSTTPRAQRQRRRWTGQIWLSERRQPSG